MRATPIAITTIALGSAILPAPSAPAQPPDEILVVGVAPAGADAQRAKLPYIVQTAAGDELPAAAGLGLGSHLERRFSGVSVNEAQGNPLQPDLHYRGYTASPLLGLAAGLAVYQGGIRVNEPLGDTVNWELLPVSAIKRVTLSGGANPLFGLNSLGGALAVDMKDGFDNPGQGLALGGGSFGRRHGTLELGGNDGSFGYYLNVDRFTGDGWRDHSPSEALNAWASVGWRGARAALDVNAQLGDSDLTGNGTVPVELLEQSRTAIFTGPDITANELAMVSTAYSLEVRDAVTFGANAYWRRNRTASFNGDGTEFTVCQFGEGAGLVEGLREGLDEDELEEAGLSVAALCDGSFSDLDALEWELARAFPAEDDLDLDLDLLAVTGSGVLSDEAVNHISDRDQTMIGGDFQWTLRGAVAGLAGQATVGGAWHRGESEFLSRVELSRLDAMTRLTTGLGTGSFVTEGAVDVFTATETASLFANLMVDLGERLTLTLSARANATKVELRDRSGLRPELNGRHDFKRVNPAIGFTWQANPRMTWYGGLSMSSRAPTPIELACNEGVFELAVQFAEAAGEDGEDIDFECRLPNAFLADPPLDDVVALGAEFGLRGSFGEAMTDGAGASLSSGGWGEVSYRLGLFRSVNQDDIIFQGTGRATGLFANVDETRRVGFEAGLRGRRGGLSWFANYTYLRATFGDRVRILSPNHRAADEQGQITVSPGDRLPGLPARQFRIGADYRFGTGLWLGAGLAANGAQTLRGDEANLLEPVASYLTLDLRARYAVSAALETFVQVTNALDARYETFGLLGEEPDELGLPDFDSLTDPRFLSPAAPRAVMAGLRLRF